MISTPVPWQPCSLADWQATQAKHVFDISLGKMLQPSPSNPTDVEAPYIKAVNVQWNSINIEDLPTMWASLGEIKALNLKVGDLLVCEGGEVGRASILENVPPESCIYQNALHRVRSNENDVRYLKYCLKQASEAGWFDVLCNRATIAHFTVEKFRELCIHIPSADTQRLIADYLDRETARIDALVAEKEKMLALLEEKRAALISRAVTRGLDPTAPLKPSGLDWLGDIPAHWEIQPIKYLAAVGNGSTPSVDNAAYWADDGYPWLNSSVVNEFVVSQPSRFVTDIALMYCHLPKIDPPAVLVGITGQGKTRGMSAVLGITATINQHLAYIKPLFQKLDVLYLKALLECAYNFLRSDSDGAGSTKGAITCEQLANLKIPVPPRAEQKEITELIDNQKRNATKVCEALQQSINLAKERRAALITAAVTGQIPAEEMRP